MGTARTIYGRAWEQQGLFTVVHGNSKDYLQSCMGTARTITDHVLYSLRLHCEVLNRPYLLTPQILSNSFDVALLMPRKYGGVSEVPTHTESGYRPPLHGGGASFPSFQHQTMDGASFQYDRVRGGASSDSLSPGYPSNCDLAADDEDYNRREGVGSRLMMHDDTLDFFGNRLPRDDEDDYITSGVRRSSRGGDITMGSSGRNSPNMFDRQDEGTGSGSILDMLSFRLPNRRAQSRLSTVIQVKPCDKTSLEDPSLNLDTDSLPGESCDSLNEITPATGRVARSHSFNYSYPQSTQADDDTTPPQQEGMSSPATMGTNTPQYSQLTPSHEGNFVPRKLSSSFLTASETRRSRVTL